MNVPYIMVKVLEKMKEMSGLSDISVGGLTISVKVYAELDEGQYSQLVTMLNSMGYTFYNRGLDKEGLVMEVYHNIRTNEFIALDYTKGRKYIVEFIIYFWDSHEVHT